LATKPRGWTGARTPSALKRVRTAERRAAVNGPRRSEAKTLISKAVKVASGALPGDADQALVDALSALDKAARSGALHKNAVARRKSRLTRKVNAALGGEHVQTGGKPTKTTGTAAAQKAAKARIAAGRSAKAKGAQTAAGKARAALSKSARAEAAAEAAAKAEAAATTAPVKATTTKATTARASTKAAATKAAPAKKAAATKPAAKATAKAPAKKAATAKTADKA
jgi:ribosomal protein S20